MKRIQRLVLNTFQAVSKKKFLTFFEVPHHLPNLLDTLAEWRLSQLVNTFKKERKREHCELAEHLR